MRDTFTELTNLLYLLMSYSMVTSQVADAEDTSKNKELAHIRQKLQKCLEDVKDEKGKPILFQEFPKIAEIFNPPKDKKGKSIFGGDDTPIEGGPAAEQSSQHSVDEEQSHEVKIKNLLKTLLPAHGQKEPYHQIIWNETIKHLESTGFSDGVVSFI